MFPSPLPSSIIPAGRRRSPANLPRRANDHRTNRCQRLRPPNPARRTALHATRLRRGVPQFLQTRRGVSKNASRRHRGGLKQCEIEQRALGQCARSPRLHPASPPLPRLSLHHRTTCSAPAKKSRPSHIIAAFGFLDCQPRSLLGTRRQIRPASRSVRAVPCASVPTALRRVSPCTDAPSSHACDRPRLSPVLYPPSLGPAPTQRH